MGFSPFGAALGERSAFLCCPKEALFVVVVCALEARRGTDDGNVLGLRMLLARLRLPGPPPPPAEEDGEEAEFGGTIKTMVSGLWLLETVAL
jgi:hypothetical protein